MPNCSIWPSKVYGLWRARGAGTGRPSPAFVLWDLPPIPEMMLAGDSERQRPCARVPGHTYFVPTMQRVTRELATNLQVQLMVA